LRRRYNGYRDLVLAAYAHVNPPSDRVR
jgi:hypothetical protein